jgi:hypothetical protein
MSRQHLIVRKSEVPQKSEALLRLEEMLRTVRYGSITLVIQDGKVSQIDKTEKFRLDKIS